MITYKKELHTYKLDHVSSCKRFIISRSDDKYFPKLPFVINRYAVINNRYLRIGILLIKKRRKFKK